MSTCPPSPLMVAKGGPAAGPPFFFEGVSSETEDLFLLVVLTRECWGVDRLQEGRWGTSRHEKF